MALDLKDYEYKLPEELIAQAPAEPRDKAKLLVLKDKPEDKIFSDIIDYLYEGDVLVLNNTKVSNAKILGKKDTGSPAEVILCKRLNELDWECRIKTRHPHKGVKIIFAKGEGTIIEERDDILVIRMSNEKIIEDAILPTPPYIKRKLSENEYQTVYAKNEGSLAAPTAGLHFTDELLEKIKKKGVKIVYLTLHVSYGTFKHVRDVESYIMDPESYEITKENAEAINNRKGRLIVVGTTSLKALESSSKDGKVIPSKGESKLFIYPPFKFNSGTDILVTNFHLPKSTLLLLTCAFGGKERILKAYEDAVKKKYHFFSLGDAMMIYK